MNFWQAVVLGLVQGLTEFLPVSSSGHLVFLQRLFSVELEETELFFDLILHLGTLVAVCAIFWKDVISLFKKPYKKLGYLLLASVPAAIVGFLLDDLIEKYFYGGAFLSAGFLVTAAVLFATEIYAKRRKKELPLSLKTVIPMGLAQAVAVLPGISRSGSTICAGTLAGGRTEDVTEFSFLMSIPVILGGFLVSLVKGLIKGEIQAAFRTAPSSFGLCVALGFVCSAFAGLFAIKIMLKAIKKANYKWFSLYLVALAIVCITLYSLGLFN